MKRHRFDRLLRKRVAALMIASLMILGIFAGCNGSPQSSASSTSSSRSSSSGSVSSGASTNQAEDNSIQFPLAEPITITCYVEVPQNITQHLQSLNDHPVFMQREADTNIHLEFVTTELSVLLASNSIPDMFIGLSRKYPGGAEKAVQDGVLVDLRDYIQYAPNYEAIMNDYPEIGRQLIMDSGTITGFSTIHLTREIPWWGPLVNKTILDELGRNVPETISEWHDMLVAFKNYGIEKPFNPAAWNFKVAWQYNSFVSAYGVSYGYYNQDGVVKYGPIEPGFKEFLAEMNKWYVEGLLDPDFTTPDYGAIAAGVLNRQIGSIVRNYFLSEFSDPDNGVEMVAAPYPKINKGDTLHLRQSDFQNKGANSICISTKNPHIPETVAWADYNFSTEGYLLWNYGVEGRSWTWEDGPPSELEQTMMPESLKNLNRHPSLNFIGVDNPNNITPGELKYINTIHASFGFLRTPYNDFYEDSAKIAKVWQESAGDDWVIPVDITQTPAEQTEIAAAQTDIDTFVDETVIQFILGLKSLDEFDAYATQVRQMGMDMILKHKQAALERYNKR